MIYNLYKNRGETPLECIERFKDGKKERLGGEKDEKMTYLGRLDPLAEGVLLVGSGEDTTQEKREKFFGLDKEYEFSAIFGFATDTYDVMGKVVKVEPVEELNQLELIKLCKIYEGEREQKYPEYSSKIQVWNSLDGAHQGKSKCVVIHKLNFLKLSTLSNKELFSRIFIDLSRVKGDFRQPEILEIWRRVLLDSRLPSPEQVREHLGDTKCGVGYFSAHVSSGTYIRSLVNDIGTTLGCGATTLWIRRTRVGEHLIKDSIR